METGNNLKAVGRDVNDISEKGGHHTRILFMAAWFGLVTGLAEVSALAVKKFILHRTIGLSPHVVWMAPLADLLLFVAVGVFLSLLAWRWRRLVSLRVAAFIFSFLSFLSLLLMSMPLHLYAKLILAAGVAVQASRLTARSKRFQALVPRTSIAMVGLILAMGIGVQAWHVRKEHVASANLPPAAPNAPNVILITLDTVRAKSLSVYGHSRQTTPNLERLARRGVLFEQALSTTSWTLPSHASIFTGHLPRELSLTWEDAPLGAKYQTLAESLSAQGYATAGFAANHLYCSYEHGLDRGFAHYEDYEISPGQIAQSSSLVRTIANNYSLRHLVGSYELFDRKTAPEVNASFLGWLSHQKGRPFFAFLNYYDAHSPYLPPEPFKTKFAQADERRNPWLFTEWKWSPQDIQAELNAYEASIAYLDHQLGLLFDELQKQGVFENTLVILTADHGEEFGEHGVMGHGSSLYLQSLQVPLLITFPTRVPEGKAVRNPVSLSDIPATVADLLGINSETHFPGTSLARYWDATHETVDLDKKPLLFELEFAPNLPQRYPVSKGNLRSLLVGRYYYIKNGDGHEELYDLESDPSQQNDLVRSGGAIADLEPFRVALEQISHSSAQSQTRLLP